MLERLREIERRYEEISSLLADPEVLKDPTRYAELAKEHANLGGIVEPYGRLKEILASLEESSSMLEDPDPEIRSLAREELAALEREKELLETRIRCLLLPRDPNDERHVILEIRAGTGGDEAALFAADLFRMYCRYAEEKGWDVEILSANETGIGGFKEVIAGIRGRGAYSRLKYESGVHRVQRVPVTEASGRIHTSAVTVAVLPEAEEVDVAIDPNDLRIETFRAS
ncbi:MAG TPA: PCRF domain-containing protein, partial [Deltaproteobacteria bacterium]|nr:PCRF domain-containing protein [Deltaproteobacteria bacterium]